MSTISNVDQVLSEMRRLAATAQGGIAESQQAQTGGADFSELLKQSVKQVNELQSTAGTMSAAFSSGDPNVDVTEVMVALQKAGVAFQAMSEVRNKLVSAYQEIMSMQV